MKSLQSIRDTMLRVRILKGQKRDYVMPSKAAAKRKGISHVMSRWAPGHCRSEVLGICLNLLAPHWSNGISVSSIELFLTTTHEDGAEDVNKAKENSRNWQYNPGRMALLKVKRERER